MQTFLPYPDFHDSVRCLDYRRLGKQRVEAMQIMKALKSGGSWSNHPATKMWKGYEKALGVYMNICIIEWVFRGYKNTMKLADVGSLIQCEYPHWFGNEEFHASHRSNLLRKDPDFYGKFGWTESCDLPYVWPV